MTARARYSIGIDLGTTNTALAFVALAGDGPPVMFDIPQVESISAIVEAATLPSFLYLPETAGLAAQHSGERLERWIIGRFARANAVQLPGRVIHSAKSWLAHHSADRTAPFLPWGSQDVEGADKLSPVQASALILRYLREAWNYRFETDDAQSAFNAQIVTITVPASFDAAAQRLTLSAAQEAGFPATVRLLEEPQAALYHWLDLHDAATDGWMIPKADGSPRIVLVVDIGGGTSDFSLFAFSPQRDGEAHRKRIAVSEHLLLGGDNMDLALAHRLEAPLTTDGEALTARQWEYLVARCRDLKEAALGTDGPPTERFAVSIPGRGSRLIAEARAAQLERADIERLLLDGFFPECDADEYPIRSTTALREAGLPYARDPAITRHLADFLRDRPAVDAVLFNGGALYPQRVRRRIAAEIGKWQGGALPVVLDNTEPDLAVARGAARFGALVDARAQRIEAGTAHAIFIQLDRAIEAADGPSAATLLVCVLPQGAPTEQTFAIRNVPLELRINALVRFQPFSSTRHAADRAGDIVAWNDADFQPLPPLETAARTGSGAAAARETVPVRLTARLSELGQLELACTSTDPAYSAAWPLEFNLREAAPPAPLTARPASAATATAVAGPNVAAEALAAARQRIHWLFGRRSEPRDRLTATRLIKSLETILQTPKHAWNVVLVRSLWATLDECAAQRSLSVEHDEAWLILAGFLLRPGFGAAMDEARIDRLWQVCESAPAVEAKTVIIQQYVLWRRVAGGLSRERQERVLAPERVKLREQQSPPPELVLLAGALERLELERKSELVGRFTEAAAALDTAQKHNAHFLAALGFLLQRAPLYGGPETVLPPELVRTTFEILARFNWDGPRRIELQTLFLRAARVVDDRRIDLSRSLRNQIAAKLESSGVPPSRTAPLRDYVPLQRAERAGSFGESLPPGLILRSTAKPDANNSDDSGA